MSAASYVETGGTAVPERNERPRWRATITYRQTARTTFTDIVELVEIGDLHDIVEEGPDWNTIADIVIERINHVVSAGLTIEQSEKQ